MTRDARGREVFSIAPELLGGAATYRTLAPDEVDAGQERDGQPPGGEPPGGEPPAGVAAGAGVRGRPDRAR